AREQRQDVALEPLPERGLIGGREVLGLTRHARNHRSRIAHAWREYPTFLRMGIDAAPGLGGRNVGLWEDGCSSPCLMTPTVSGSYLNDQNVVVDFTAALPSGFDPSTSGLTKQLDDHNVDYRFTGQSLLASLLIQTVPFILLMVVLYYFVFRRMGAGASAAL